MSVQDKSDRRFLFFFGLFIAALFAAVFLPEKCSAHLAAKEFAGVLEEAIQKSKYGFPNKSPAISGKVAVIDRDGSLVLMPGEKEWVAVEPGQVSAVVVVEETKERVGKYEGGGTAYRTTLDIVVVRLQEEDWFEWTITKDPPDTVTILKTPTSSSKGIGASGKKEAVAELVGWIEGLLEVEVESD